MRRWIAILLSLSVLSLVAPVWSDDAVPDYRAVAGWPKVPDEIKLGPVSAVAADSADRIFVGHRGPRPILVFERGGKFLRSWGDEQIKTVHGVRIDHENNVWVTDI